MIIVTTLIIIVSIHPNLIGQTAGLSPLTLWMADFNELSAVVVVSCLTEPIIGLSWKAGILVAAAG